MRKPSEIKPWMALWGDHLPDLSLIECNVYDYIYKNNKEYKNNVALNYFDRKITFGEMFANIQQTAQAFQKLGVQPGDIVTMCTVMTPETIYSFYALDLLGATLNMVDPRTSSFGLREYITEVHSRVVCTLDAAYDKVISAVKGTAVEQLIVISPADSLSPVKKLLYHLGHEEPNEYDQIVIRWKDFMDSAIGSPEVKPYAFNPDHAVIIVHTGGTTGKPKGVLLGDRSINALAIQMTLKRYKRGERFLNVMPPFIAYGFGCGIHAPLSGGGEVILIPKLDPSTLGTLIKKYRPEHTAGVPLHYQTLASDPKMKNADLSYLISTGSGGDGITVQAEEIVNKFLREHHAKYLLCKGYGMSEVSAGATACIGDINKTGSVGIPLYLTTVGVFKPDTDEELDFDEQGEICLQTPAMMIGYYNMPEETENVIRKHSDGKLWVHTGDIGRIDMDGYLFITNRIKRVIIRHDGFKVFPSMIENVVCSVPGVELACAVGVRDQDHEQGNLPFVFIKAYSSYSGGFAELEDLVRRTCETELPEYVQPVGYRFVENLPYTNIGKVDYLSLQESAKSINYKNQKKERVSCNEK